MAIMSDQRDIDLKTLLGAVLDEVPPEPPRSPFAQKLIAALTDAVAAMRADGVLEVEDGNVENLVIEVAEAGLDSNSPKHLMKKVIRTLLASEYVEEIYATDDELSTSLRRFLDPD